MHFTAGECLIRNSLWDTLSCTGAERKQFQRQFASVNFVYLSLCFHLPVWKNSATSLKFNQAVWMEVESDPFRNWWPGSKEVWTVTSVSAEVPVGWEMGTFLGKKVMEEKPLAEQQSLGAVASSGTVLMEAGRSVGGNGNNNIMSLHGRRHGDSHPLGCWDAKDGCKQDWDPETRTFMAEWLENPCCLSS